MALPSCAEILAHRVKQTQTVRARASQQHLRISFGLATSGTSEAGTWLRALVGRTAGGSEGQ